MADAASNWVRTLVDEREPGSLCGSDVEQPESDPESGRETAGKRADLCGKRTARRWGAGSRPESPRAEHKPGFCPTNPVLSRDGRPRRGKTGPRPTGGGDIPSRPLTLEPRRFSALKPDPAGLERSDLAAQVQTCQRCMGWGTTRVLCCVDANSGRWPGNDVAGCLFHRPRRIGARVWLVADVAGGWIWATDRRRGCGYSLLRGRRCGEPPPHPCCVIIIAGPPSRSLADQLMQLHGSAPGSVDTASGRSSQGCHSCRSTDPQRGHGPRRSVVADLPTVLPIRGG
jgi:hypothetical protein